MHSIIAADFMSVIRKRKILERLKKKRKVEFFSA